MLIFSTPPEPTARLWVCDNFSIDMVSYPNIFWRTMQRVVFGFRWEIFKDT